MSGSVAKASRRDLRRALGATGLHTLQGLSALVTQTVIPSVEQATDTINQQNRELEAHDRQLADYHARLERLETESKARAVLTFWGRMHWALTGH